MPLKTLFLNPPSFENFDGGAGSRWPATREIESYWYPVWLAYPAGMLEGARLLDAPPHYVSAEQTINIAKEYEFLVLFTSTPGFPGDIGLAQAIKAANPGIKIAFVGPHVSVLPEKSLKACPAIDFVCRKEFDLSVVEFAQGKPLEQITGISISTTVPWCTTPIERRSSTWTPCRTLLTSISGISMSVATTFPSCLILLSRFTQPGAVRRSARSACGRRH